MEPKFKHITYEEFKADLERSFDPHQYDNLTEEELRQKIANLREAKHRMRISNQYLENYLAEKENKNG